MADKIEINYDAMSPKELLEHEQALQKAKRDIVEGAPLDVIAAIVLKWAHSRLKKRGKLGIAFDGINIQAFPKESLMGSPADLSETQIETIRKEILSAIEKAAVVKVSKA